MSETARPYLLISLGLHLALALLLFLIKGPQVSEAVRRKVVIEFSQTREITPPMFAAEPSKLPDLAPQQMAESLNLQGPSKLAMPAARSATVPPSEQASARGGERLTYVPEQKPLLPGPGTPSAAPRLPAQLFVEELAAVPSVESDTESTVREGSTGDSGFTEAGALEWRGRERRLLKTAGIPFPDILLEEGLEVDVVAVFTVAANGQVVEVDIIRSSGYASVDTAVQRALYSYLFERSEDDNEDIGQVQVRFRLERGD
jgi:outer membrane biosynthesis protein TonB